VKKRRDWRFRVRVGGIEREEEKAKEIFFGLNVVDCLFLVLFLDLFFASNVFFIHVLCCGMSWTMMSGRFLTCLIGFFV
jgi:hypothetical protein